MTRLSKSYQHALLTKIKETFTENQQQLFVSSFYCFLNHNPTTDFVIDFDLVWKWVGYERKSFAKRSLVKHFTLDIDYTLDLVEKPAATDAEAGFRNLGSSGLNREIILLTVKAFKKFCLKAGTKRADEIHEYYLKLEELLLDTINKETDELRNQLIKTETENVALKKSLLQSHTKNTHRHDFKTGPAFYIVENPDSKYAKYKIGIVSTNFNDRS